jgi:diadenosine tetraphosphatase ApaH/serine/threonine PP2A family protein phosphatase
MKKTALISDIHGNFEALKSVFEHIDNLGDIEDIICLGDIVGYGPQPEECIDMISERCSVCLMGNHDNALINAAEGFNHIAAGAIVCIRKRMEPGIFSLPEKEHRWTWLRNLPERHETDEALFVHASPRDNLFEYILPDDPIFFSGKMSAIFSMIDNLVFVGHTHIPGIFQENKDFLPTSKINNRWTLNEGQKCVVNVSSVGQPRDKDNRACYAVITDKEIVWHRIEYDIEKTIERIFATDCLDNRCGTRLREGR